MGCFVEIRGWMALKETNTMRGDDNNGVRTKGNGQNVFL